VLLYIHNSKETSGFWKEWNGQIDSVMRRYHVRRSDQWCGESSPGQTAGDGERLCCALACHM